MYDLIGLDLSQAVGGLLLLLLLLAAGQSVSQSVINLSQRGHHLLHRQAPQLSGSGATGGEHRLGSFTPPPPPPALPTRVKVEYFS